MDDLLVVGHDINGTVAEMAAFTFFKDKALDGPLGRNMHLVSQNLNLDVTIWKL